MGRASKAPRVIAGYGGGAATPSPTTREIPARRRTQAQVQRATNWKPSVQRDRPTTAPSAAAQKPVNTQPTPKAETPKPTPTPKTPRRLPLGFGKAVGVYNTMEKGVSGFKDKAWEKAPSGIRKISNPARGVYSGGMGKFNMVQDGLVIGANVKNLFDSKETATDLYNSYRDKYASVEDAESEVKWQAVTNIVSVGADNIAQQMVNRGAQAAVRFVAARAFGMAAGAALGPIGFALTIVAFAVIDNMTREKATTADLNPAGEAATSVENAFQSSTMLGTTFLNNAVMPAISPSLRSIGWSNTEKNSPIDVQNLKAERNPTNYRFSEYDENGDLRVAEYKVYESFGKRKDEVGMLLDLGYFLTPAVDDKGQPVVNTWENPLNPSETITYRSFDLDGFALQEWLESTDWTFGKGNIKDRMDGLPPIDNLVQQALFKEPLTGREKNITVESWYNMVRNDASLKPQR